MATAWHFASLGFAEHPLRKHREWTVGFSCSSSSALQSPLVYQHAHTGENT